MFGRQRGAKDVVAGGTGAVADAAEAAIEYVDPLVGDEKLRERLATAIVAGVAARNRVRRQRGMIGLARRIASDEILRAQLVDLARALQGAEKRAKKARRGHRARNTVLLVSGAGMAVAAVPGLRSKVVSLVERGRDRWAPAGRSEPSER